MNVEVSDMTTDLPKQIDKRVREAIRELPIPWEIIKTRDNYFLQVLDKRFCIGNNASKQPDRASEITARKIRHITQKPEIL